jgi:2-methylisocitrate lyase-like PEP mutase family enzyme
MTFRALMQEKGLAVAPVALNALMACMAEQAGFRAVYLSGGSLGWQKCITEANLTLPELVDVGIEIRSATKIPIVLDGGAGWGDPVHMHRTIALTEAAGFAAIEIEDQYLPRRVHHHIGIETLIEPQDMVVKIKEAVAARSNPDLMIIARTNAQRLFGIDEAIRRGEMFLRAGADMLFVHSRTPEELRKVGEALPAPLMLFAPEDGFADAEMSKEELASLGFRLAASSGTAFVAMYKACRQSYECLARDEVDPFLGPGGAVREMKLAREAAGLTKLLDIERRTTLKAT